MTPATRPERRRPTPPSSEGTRTRPEGGPPGDRRPSCSRSRSPRCSSCWCGSSGTSATASNRSDDAAVGTLALHRRARRARSLHQLERVLAALPRQRRGSGLFENWFLFLARPARQLICPRKPAPSTASATCAWCTTCRTRAAPRCTARTSSRHSAAPARSRSSACWARHLRRRAVLVVMLCICLAVVGLALARHGGLPAPRGPCTAMAASRAGWRSLHAGFDQIRERPGVGVARRAHGDRQVLRHRVAVLGRVHLLGIDESVLAVSRAGRGRRGRGVHRDHARRVRIPRGVRDRRRPRRWVPASTRGCSAPPPTGRCMLAASIVLGAAGFLITYPRLRAFRATPEQSAEPA